MLHLADRNADEQAVPANDVSLEYPNGRSHDCTIELDQLLRPGATFELHGRQWLVTDPPRRPSWKREPEPEPRLHCVSVSRVI